MNLTVFIIKYFLTLCTIIFNFFYSQNDMRMYKIFNTHKPLFCNYIFH